MASWYDQDQSESYDVFGASDEVPRLDNQSTPKIPPAFNGRSSWFAYEEAIDDWLDITTLSKDKLGPSLKNRLYEDATIYKPLLERETLIHEDT